MTAKPGQQMISVTVELPGSRLGVEVGIPHIPPPSLPAAAGPGDLARLAHQAAAAFLPSWSASVEAAVAAKLPQPRPKRQAVRYGADDRVSEISEWEPDPPASVTARAVAQKVVSTYAPAVEGAYLKLLTSALASRLAAQHQRLEGKPR